jgi:hypothetical protein
MRKSNTRKDRNGNPSGLKVTISKPDPPTWLAPNPSTPKSLVAFPSSPQKDQIIYIPNAERELEKLHEEIRNDIQKLIQPASTHSPKAPCDLPSHNGLVFDEARHRLCIDGVWEELKDEEVKMWVILWKAQAEWTSSKTISPRAPQIKYSMAPRVKAEIDYHRRSGYRLKRFLPK